MLPVPSPLLLSSSILLLIASVGSVFTDTPNASPLVSYALPLVGVPGGGLLFLCAIRKGQRETEEDDEKFRGGG
ncbi:hypothetical protein TeGR_g490 [Tetraparma gracilis]|uniref:Uncharacterized protein n=1 Tax=Tetraparma gracilis TaxID=2962635 RepID=A0ABQ6MFI8_9STRA|nr:hypothetical protein TeGR_g490 [Tetraparma gracilis]